jgi:hypothetical protein
VLLSANNDLAGDLVEDAGFFPTRFPAGLIRLRIGTSGGLTVMNLRVA